MMTGESAGMMSDQRGLIGTRLDTYEIQALVGSGGMGSVYKAFDHNLQRQVAIKVLSAGAAAQHGFADRFRQEALLIARLHHPNIVQVYDYGEQNGLTFMVEELLPGPTLNEQIARANAGGVPLSREQVLKIVGDIANGLTAAHAAGIIHRDIKPDNAIWNARGDLVLTDFGIARVLTAVDSGYTQTGTIVGTPNYMSPEQAQGQPLTPASDVYSLGVVLYELLIGHVPFLGATPIAVVMDHISKPPPSLRPTRPDLPPAVEAVVMRALAKQPGDRFSSPVELAIALERAWPAAAAGAFARSDVHGRPTAVWPPSQPAASGADGNDGRRLWLLLSLVGGLAILLLCGATLAARGLFNGDGATPTAVAGVAVQASNEATATIASTATPETTPTATLTPEPTVPPTQTPIPLPLGLTKPIAYASNRTGNWEIFAANPDGSDLRMLTNDGAEDITPDWSPDGSQIVFQSNRDGDEEIFVMNADGSEPRNLTNNSHNDRDPAWSPDGSQIVYYSRPGGNWNIFIMNADGSNPRQITSDLSDEFLPVWSPDGQWIAFTSNAGRNDDIHIVRPDGSDRREVTTHRRADKFPAFSPDSRQIAFSSERDGHGEIYVVNIDSTDLRNLSNNSAWENQPSWSPDGLFIAFSTNRDGHSEIYTMNADGSNQVNLSNSPSEDAEASWAR